jgi:hypothetical protein
LQFELENASDLLMDIPKLWFYLGEIVGRGAFVGAILSYAAQNMVSGFEIVVNTFVVLGIHQV